MERVIKKRFVTWQGQSSVIVDGGKARYNASGHFHGVRCAQQFDELCEYL
jgi:hypothetical protein